MSTTAIYQIGQYTVPHAARADFLARMQATQKVLEAQPGFVRASVVEQPIDGDAKASRIVTIAEWRDDAAIQAARVQVAAAHAAEGFDLAAFRARHGIVADSGMYRAIDH